MHFKNIYYGGITQTLFCSPTTLCPPLCIATLAQSFVIPTFGLSADLIIASINKNGQLTAPPSGFALPLVRCPPFKFRYANTLKLTTNLRTVWGADSDAVAIICNLLKRKSRHCLHAYALTPELTI